MAILLSAFTLKNLISQAAAASHKSHCSNKSAEPTTSPGNQDPTHSLSSRLFSILNMDAKKVERARLAEDVYDDQEQDRKANATRKVRRDRLDIGEKDASDDHQKKRRNKNDLADKAKFLEDAKKFRDGACVNCGDLRHNAKNCLERPRLCLAKYSSRNPRDRFDFAKVRRGGLDCGEKHAWDDHHQKKNQYYDQDQEDIPEANATAKSEAPGK